MNQLSMTWNKSHGCNNSGFNNSNEFNKHSSNNQSGRNDNNGPPDLEEIFNNLLKKIASLFGSGKNVFENRSYKFNGPNKIPGSQSNIIIFFILGIILLIYLLSGFYIVRPAEQSVVTRFGRFNRTVGPGPHWIMRIVEKNTIVNSEEVGFSKHSASMLTRDENIVFVAIEVQYRIYDVKDYLFNVAEPLKTLKQAIESAMRQVIGNAKLDFIMTEGRAQIAVDIEQQLTAILDKYDSGIQIITVAFKEAKAPDAVKAAFDDVIKAREEQERLKHDAEAFANKIVPEAKGDAERMLVEAEAYKQETIAKAYGDALRFDAILEEYKKSPDITKKRIYIESIEEILANSNKILIDLKNSNNLVYLPLDQLTKNNNNANNNIIVKGE
jgi:modulator of FtsH protease HflK